MGLIAKGKSWLAARYLRAAIKAAQEWAEKQRAGLAGQEGNMVWAKALGAAFIGGVATAAADALANGFTLDKAGLIRLGTAALAGGLVAAAGYLKQSPIKPPEAK